MPERFLRRVGADAALVVLSRVLGALTLVALTPLIVAELGKDGYGVWIVVMAATGLAGLFDVGIGPAVSRVVAVALARGDDAALRRTVSTAVVASLVLGSVLVVAGWLIAPALARLLELPESLRRDAVDALRIAVLTFAITSLSSILEGVLIGQQRFRMLLAVRVGAVVAFALAAVATLRLDYGVVGLAAGQAGAMTLALVLGLTACWPSVRPRARPLVARERLRELLRFGLPQQTSRIAYAGAVHYERLLVGVLLGAGVAAELGAASVVIAALCSLLAHATVVLVPALTRLHADDAGALEEAFRRAVATFTPIAAGLVGVVATAAAPLMTAWLGAGFSASARYLQILAIGYGLWAVANPGFALAQARGRPGVEARGAGAAILVNAGVTTAAIALVGVGAIAFGTSAALALGALAFWGFAAKRVPLPHGALVATAAPVLVAALLAAGVAAAAELLVALPQDRLAAFGLAAAQATLFAAGYVLVLSRLRLLPDVRPVRTLARPAAGPTGS